MERTANYSGNEKQLLVALVDKYKHIIESKETNAIFLKNKHDSWKSVAAEFNANTTQPPRSVKQIKTLYFNMKRKVKKDVATEHKKEYMEDKKVAAKDKKEIKKTGGGAYSPKLDEAGAQLLPVIAEQIDPLPNSFDDAAVYFADVDDENVILKIEAPQLHPEPPVQKKPAVARISERTIKKTVNYKQLYFKKKYEIACFELKSKKILHNLDVKLKKKQLAEFENK